MSQWQDIHEDGGQIEQVVEGRRLRQERMRQPVSHGGGKDSDSNSVTFGQDTLIFSKSRNTPHNHHLLEVYK